MISYLLVGSVAGAVLGWLMGFLSLFLILLVLIQRGKGGGLTGALGGPGGQSAFGSKAGDTFTLITVVVACVWGFVCAFTMWLLGTHSPTVTMKDDTIKSGPSEQNDANKITLPSLDSTGPGGLSSGLSAGPSSDDSGSDSDTEGANAESTETEGEDSMELEPASEADASSQEAEASTKESSNESN